MIINPSSTINPHQSFTNMKPSATLRPRAAGGALPIGGAHRAQRGEAAAVGATEHSELRGAHCAGGECDSGVHWGREAPDGCEQGVPGGGPAFDSSPLLQGEPMRRQPWFVCDLTQLPTQKLCTMQLHGYPTMSPQDWCLPFHFEAKST